MGGLLETMTQAEARRAARRRAERAPAELREPAVRSRLGDRARRAVSRRRIRTTGRPSARWRISTPPRSRTCSAFFRTYYAPNNATLADRRRRDGRARCARCVERYFARHRAAVRPCRRSSRRRAARGRVAALVLEDDVTLPRLYIAWHSPAHLPAGRRRAGHCSRACSRTARRRGSTAARLRAADRAVRERVPEQRGARLARSASSSPREPGRRPRRDSSAACARRSRDIARGRRRRRRSWTARATARDRLRRCAAECGRFRRRAPTS